MDDNFKVILAEIPCAENEPTKYQSNAYIRVGTNLKPLMEYQEKEAELWRMFDNTLYELRIASSNKTEDETVMLLNYSEYYDKLELPIPRSRDKVLEDLQNEKFIKKNDAGNWDITNLGALMIGKDLKKFENLSRRSVRVIWYKNNTRLEAVREKEFVSGYAIAYEDIIQYIMTIIPQEEVIVESTRKSVLSFPEIAIRELLANTMIHQSLEKGEPILWLRFLVTELNSLMQVRHWCLLSVLLILFRYREMRIWQGLCINVVFAKNVEVDLTKSLRLQVITR